MATVWINADQCTGCGECVTVCPAEAILLQAGKAYVNAARCRGCEACVGVCPTAAIQPVLEGELAPTSKLPLAKQPVGPLASPVSPPLRQTALAVAVTAGTGLALRAVQGLARAAGRWLLRPHDATSRQREKRQSTPSVSRTGGQRTRRRQRRR